VRFEAKNVRISFAINFVTVLQNFLEYGIAVLFPVQIRIRKSDRVKTCET